MNTKTITLTMNINIDLSDDVSALSMDGASAIAMNINLIRRITRDSSEKYNVQPRIPEDEDCPIATVIVVDSESTQRRNEEEDRSNGKKLIEEFSTTPEMWQKRREKKYKLKSKELGDLSSNGRSDEERKHREQNRHKCKSKTKKSSKCSRLQEQGEDHEIGESSRTLSTTEISVQSTKVNSTKSEPVTPPFCYASDHKRASDFLSFPSIVSTVESDNTRSAGTATVLSRHEERCPSMSHYLSLSGRESMTITTEHSTHTSGLHSYANRSQVTVEDIHKLHIKLHRAKKEKEQVLRIHEQLVDEIRLAKERETEAVFCKQQFSLLIEAATLDHQQLQKHLMELHNENTKLGIILSKLEESEDERSFIELLDNMNAKMKSYKAKSR